MKHRSSRARTGRDAQLWPVLLLLLAVLVPTVCLVWLMSEAIENQRLAVRQQLEDAYRGHLVNLRDRLEEYWLQKTQEAEQLAERGPGSAVFAHCVRSRLADSAVCYDARGQLAYPAPPPAPQREPGEHEAAFAEAARLERQDGELTAAAEAYARIAREAADAHAAARALQAQARCLVQAGDHDAAIQVVTQSLSQDKYRQAVDPEGRLIVANAELLALRLISDASDARFRETAARLKGRLADYDDPVLPAAQRRFLMKELEQLLPGEVEFPTLAAEDLAARFAETHPAPRAEPVLYSSQLPDVWQVASPSGRVVLLFTTEGVIARMHEAIAAGALPAGVSVRLVSPEQETSQEAIFDLVPAGRHLPGWQLALLLVDQDLLDAAADQQIAMYFWIGILVIAAMSVFALLIARTWRRQMRMARLKNDLVATVSHELKTPLSSIRLLVDTLLDAKQLNEKTLREYLELVAKENARLSRLIDNFLAFSRMERDKHAFQFREVAAAEIIDGAVDAVRERFSLPGCRFEVKAAPDLPPLTADPDALVTAVLNLLDNAYKYSGEDKHIVLRAYGKDGNVCFEVEDNGIGLSRRAAKKVFDRFYQVDRRLSRSGSGCGLGLSIVRFIVDAHGGTVHVASQPGRGSTFRVTIPCASTGAHASQGASA